MSDVRDKIRAATVGEKKNFIKKIVEYNGIEIEIRQPSIGGRADIMRKCKTTFKDREGNEKETFDMWEFLTMAVIYCSYVPGTEEKIFDDHDYESILASPTGSFIDEFSTELIAILNVDEEQIEKNSVAILKDNSSTESLST